MGSSSQSLLRFVYNSVISVIHYTVILSAYILASILSFKHRFSPHSKPCVSLPLQSPLSADSNVLSSKQHIVVKQPCCTSSVALHIDLSIYSWSCTSGWMRMCKRQLVLSLDISSLYLFLIEE